MENLHQENSSLQSFSDQTKTSYQDAKEKVLEKASDLKDRAAIAALDFQDRANEYAKNTSEFVTFQIKKSPLQSLFAAAAFGFCLSFLIGKKSSNYFR